MDSITYLRYMIGKGLRITQGVTDKMQGRGVKGPDHIAIWSRTCVQVISIEGDRITIKMADGKIHVLVADSTGITTTGKGRWIELKWNVKYSFINLHILADEESQKILAFRVVLCKNIRYFSCINPASYSPRNVESFCRALRVIDTSGGDARNLPGMLDQALDGLGIPLEDRGTYPAVSVGVDGTQVD